MATKKSKTNNKKVDIDTAIDKMIKVASQVHDNAYKISENLVDEAYRASNEWNKIAQKAIKGGVKILAKQQNIALDAIEGVVSNYGYGAKRFQKFIGIDIVKEVKAKTAEAKEAIENAITNVSDKIEHVINDADNATKARVKSVKSSAKKTTKKTKAITKKTVSKTEVSSDLTKAKKTITAKKTPSKTKIVINAEATNLTIIKGIGPKTMNILHDSKINTIADLAKSTSKELDAILDGKGKIYQTVDTQVWIEAAKKIS